MSHIRDMSRGILDGFRFRARGARDTKVMRATGSLLVNVGTCAVILLGLCVLSYGFSAYALLVPVVLLGLGTLIMRGAARGWGRQVGS